MEMLVIGLIAIAAFAAVLFPLFRRRPGYGDESEFENIPPARQANGAGEAGAAGAAPGTPDAAPDAAPPGTPDAAPGAAPGMTAGATGRPGPSLSPASAARPDDPIEAEVLRYREAVRAGTVCRKCGQANPGDSGYCFECGARLPLADAKEFE